MIKILFSDDNERLFEDFKDRAFKMGIDLHCVTNWEDAQVALDQNWDKYDGLILDGKGKLDEAAGGNDAKHLSRSLGWLNQQYAKGQFMPTIVYSAYIGTGAGSLEEHIDAAQPFLLGLYNKDVDVEIILDKIATNSANLPAYRLKYQYQDIFKLFDDKRLPKNMAQTMLDVLSGLSQASQDKTDYNRIRDLIEAMLKMANSIDGAFVPDKLLNPAQNGRPNLGLSEIYFSGRDILDFSTKAIVIAKTSSPIMKDHVSKIYGAILNSCHIFSHNTTHKHYPYAYKSTVFGLLEILLWYRDYLTTKYKI